MKNITLIFMLLLSCCGFAQLANEDFEGTWTAGQGPTDWQILNLAGPAQTWIQGNGGSTQPAFDGLHSAYVNSENVAAGTQSEDWLITKAFTIPASAQLRFQSRLFLNLDQLTTYKVMISTTVGDATVQATTANYVPLQTWTELEINPVQQEWNEVVLNINTVTYPVGTQVYIAFVMMGDNGDRWAIDDVKVVEQCLTPTALTANPQGTSAQLSWTSGAGAWEIEVLPSGGSQTFVGVPYTGALPYTAPGLTPSTPYKYYVRATCSDSSSPWAGPFTFTTSQIAATFPVAEGFEDTINWGFSNGTQTNQWYTGTATNNGGTHSMYISNNAGVNNTYTVSPATATSTVMAYRDILIPAGAAQANFSFDWKSYGESCCDYLRVWWVPASFTPVAGTVMTAANSGGVQVAGNFNVNGNWTTYSTIINVGAYANTVRRLVFEWHNDFSVGTQPPAAIDNINLSLVTCPQPTALAAAPSSTNANLSWTNQGTATDWEVYVVTSGSAAPTAATDGTDVTGGVPSYLYSPLLPATAYQYYVRALCSATDKSIWSGPFAFTTAIANDNCDGAVVLPVNLTNNCTQSTQVSFTGATASSQPVCAGVNGGDIWYQFTASQSSQTIELSNFTGTAQPVVLGLYDGGDCGTIGSTLFCSENNVIIATGLTPNAVYYLRASLNTTSPNLNISFAICVKSPPPPTASTSSECVITTVNFDFENPDVTGTYPTFLNHNVVQGWRTTASDQMMEFWPAPNYENVPAYSGNQFIELNANLVSGVYQDYQSPAGTVFTYGFAHRGRQGTDTCQLKAGPPGGPYVNVGSPVSTGNTAWSYNTGTYTVPATQGTTRFIFQSVSSVGGASVGNYLDAITFSANNGIVSVTPAAVNCASNTTAVVTQGTGVWTAHADNPSVTTFGNATSNTTTISGFSAVGTYHFDWTTAFCVSTTEIVFNESPVAPPVATTAINYCLGQTATALTATPLAGNTLNWYSDAAGTLPLSAAPTPDTSALGSTIYYVSQTQLICESPLTAITVTINDIPVAPTTTDVLYCKNAVATPLTATGDGTNTIKWYAVATGGTALFTAPTPNTSFVGTTVYYASQVSAFGCESTRVPLTVSVINNFTPITAFTLPATVCASGTNPVPVQSAGYTTGGTYTASPALTINATTGEIDLATTAVGTYTITYSVAADPASCHTSGSSQATITITAPVAPVTTFSYTNVCELGANQLPTLTTGFATGGTFTSTAGLTINTATGEITTATSTPGSYTITYTVAADVATCTAAGTNSAVITITPASTPVTTFSYVNICTLQGNQVPALTAGFATGGTFTSTAGLTVNGTTGEITTATSTPGTYTITYTVAASVTNCSAAAVNSATITIAPATTPVTGFSYTNVCSSAGNQLPIPVAGFTTGGTYASTTGLSVNAATGEITTATSTPGTYTVTYTTAQDAVNCVAAATNTAVLVITPVYTPVTAFNYDDMYCFAWQEATPTQGANFVTGGTYTITGGLSINAATGAVDTATAQPGDYTVTYTVAADPANCNLGGSSTDTFTIAAEILFTLEGECNGSAFVITATPVNASYDPAAVTYEWQTVTGAPVGNDSDTFNVSAYVSGTPEKETFPLQFTLTVTDNGCESMPVVYDVLDISCSIQKGISPGDSSDNNYFDLASMGVKKLSIFNRYGLEVYTKTNYTTQWVGQTNSGDELPTGTYFYVIERSAGESKTGWIYINRQN